MRTAVEVATRTVIHITLLTRAKFERAHTDSAQAESAQLLPWLESQGLAHALDPIERRQLETPYQQLSESELADLDWAGEAACFFGGMLGWCPQPSFDQVADPAALLVKVPVLKGSVATMIESAQFVDPSSLTTYGQTTLMIRSVLMERQNADLGSILREINYRFLEEKGIVCNDAIQSAADQIVSNFSPEFAEQAIGLYIARFHAALWFLTKQATYYEQE